MSDLLIAKIRTVVPAAVGAALAWLTARYGLDLPSELAAQLSAPLTVLLTAIYYATARRLEDRFPQLGRYLLGVAGSPTYTHRAGLLTVDYADGHGCSGPGADDLTEFTTGAAPRSVVAKAPGLVSRAEAGLRPPRSVTHLPRPEGLTVHYWGPSPWPRSADRSSAARFAATTDHAKCAGIWRGGQAFHMSPGWGGTKNGGTDIAYSSGVCPHGFRFEGRGPGVRSAANGTNPGNARSLATCYLGGDGDPLTDQAKTAFLEEARRLVGQSTPRWQHGDWKATSCAGAAIRAWKAAGWPSPGTNPAMTAPQATQPPPSPAPAPPTIRLGSAGARVSEAQAKLNAVAGAGLAVDGKFGQKTADAVRRFQRFFGLTADGVIGQRTWETLNYCAALKR